MASTLIALTLTSPSPSTPFHRKPPPPVPTIFFTLTSFRTLHHHRRITPKNRSIKAQTFDFSSTFFEQGFEGGDGEGDDPQNTFGSLLMGIDEEEKEEPQCPPGLRQYETMAILRPDMSEDDRLSLTQKYEELLVAGGGMYVDVFNRGVIPLAYDIKRKNKDGVINTYLDGIYLLFTYFTKPESMPALEEALRLDDNVIRFSSFKIRKRKY